jgi:hypothetical protein
VVLALTRTWAKRKGHAPCAMTLIRFEQDCHWIIGRLVNWKHVPPSHCAKWGLPFHQSSLSPVSPPDDQMPSDECQSCQFCWCKLNESADFTICINCNGEVHMVCADLFFFQKPSEHGFIPQKDLSHYGKSRLRKMSLTERQSVYICLLCQDRIV